MADVKIAYDKNTALRIRDFLLKQGMTVEGTYGMMANIYSESGFRSNNAQNSYMTKMGMTDESYTVQVDNGQYASFGIDRVGYGLCQWTSSGRKTGLFNYAKEQNKSISDETMQLNYLMKELTSSYKSTLNILKTSHDISECAKYVMTKFERPADQSDAAQNKRASYGLQLYKELENVKEETKMGYTNSSLVSYTRISPNKTSPRNHKLDTITIHCIVGQWTAKQGCDYFANSARNASCNYVVGKDGSIGLCVEEKDRSWCTSTAVNDHRAITIEVASDTTHPYAVTDAALNALIKLCADICKRNGIKKLVWSTNKNERVNHLNGCNMTVHRDFANKSCPGEYLYSRHGYIADEVNKLLGVSASTQSSTTRSYLMKGDKGTDVKTLQENLNYLGYNCGNADGDFGVKTDTALRNFQKAYKLTVDGKYGATSKKTLEDAVSKKKNTSTSPTTKPTTSTNTSTAVPLKVTQSKKAIQEFLNTYYGNEIKKVLGALLVVDGAIGNKSKLALGIAIQVELNKLGAGLVVDGKIGANSANAWNKYVGTLKSGSKGIFVTLWQCILVANNLDPNGIDGAFGNGCKTATNALFAKIGLSRDSSVSGSDINALL